jgi:hypothetical protein
MTKQVEKAKEKLITAAVKCGRAWDADSVKKEDELTDLLMAALDLSRALSDSRVETERRLRSVKGAAE